MTDVRAPQQQLDALEWSERWPGVPQFRGRLGGHHRIIYGEDRARLEAMAREMSEGRA